jgi:hypothetical protein
MINLNKYGYSLAGIQTLCILSANHVCYCCVNPLDISNFRPHKFVMSFGCYTHVYDMQYERMHISNQYV